MKLLSILALLAAACLVSGRSTEKAAENDRYDQYDQYELAIDEIIKPFNLMVSLFETCAPGEIRSLNEAPWSILERLNTDGCRVSVANLARHLPSISRSLSVISKRFLKESRAVEKGGEF